VEEGVRKVLVVIFAFYLYLLYLLYLLYHPSPLRPQASAVHISILSYHSHFLIPNVQVNSMAVLFMSALQT